jgi:glutamate/tyrosine decarboxylase-like PLP-dependent enzyme
MLYWRMRNNKLAIGSYFLGPKAENLPFVEEQLVEILRDHAYWRKNFHPADEPIFSAQVTRSDDFSTSCAIIRQRVEELSRRFKQHNVPFASPRYLAHMISDNHLGSLFGYFLGMLYNSNNVTHEVSPVTTYLELEVIDKLALMVGFPPRKVWGHLTSGGTVANAEALLISMRLKFLPERLLKLCLDNRLEEVQVRSVVQKHEAVRTSHELDLNKPEHLWSLRNMRAGLVLRLYQECYEAFMKKSKGSGRIKGLTFQNALNETSSWSHSSRYNQPLLVLHPANAHYSVAKCADILGLPTSNLVAVPVIDKFRMDLNWIKDYIENEVLAYKDPATRPLVAATVLNFGSTEEGAIDRIDQYITLREEFYHAGLYSYIHVDAAYGGYAIAALRSDDGDLLELSEARTGSVAGVWPGGNLYHAVPQLPQVESITIDPHKLGYVHYPAGAILFEDRRVMLTWSANAPYIFEESDDKSYHHMFPRDFNSNCKSLISIMTDHISRADAFKFFQGKYSLEGSRSGAVAAGVWLTHQITPLNCTGIGASIKNSMDATYLFINSIPEIYEGDSNNVKYEVKLLVEEPELNIVCLAVNRVGNKQVQVVNDLTRFVADHFTCHREMPAHAHNFYVSKTRLEWRDYSRLPSPVADFFKRLGLDWKTYKRVGFVDVIRIVIMHPWNPNTTLYQEFHKEMKALLRSLPV